MSGGLNGRTRSYLDLSALPAVGAMLLDPRPAFVFRGDGSALLWANAAAVAFFGAPDMATLLGRSFSRTSPLAAHVARLAKSLPLDHDRLEVLRVSFGVTQSLLSAACRRLELGAGARAVLVVGAGAAPRGRALIGALIACPRPRRPPTARPRTPHTSGTRPAMFRGCRRRRLCPCRRR